MNKLILLTLVLITTISTACHNKSSGISDDWVESEPFEDAELLAKKGDCLSFIDSSKHYFAGTVMAINKSKGRIWYGLCFTNYYDTILPDAKAIDTLKFNARKVPYYDLKNHLVGFDITWIPDTLLDSHKILMEGKFDTQPLYGMEIFGERNVPTYAYLLHSFHLDRNERLFPEKSRKNTIDTSLQPSVYMSLNELKEAKKNNQLLKAGR